MKYEIDILFCHARRVPDDYINNSVRYLVLDEQAFQEREKDRQQWGYPPTTLEDDTDTATDEV